MKLLRELYTPPESEIAPNKKTQKIRNLLKVRSRAKNKRLRDVAHNKDRKWVPDPDKMDYLKGHADNGPKFS